LGYDLGLGDQPRSYYCDCDGAPPTISSKERGAAAIAGCEGLGVGQSKAFLRELKSATKENEKVADIQDSGPKELEGSSTGSAS
jgi:hypothetical protein